MSFFSFSSTLTALSFHFLPFPSPPPADISDCERDISSPVPATVPVSQDMESRQQAALNYSSLAATAAAVAVGNVPTAQDPTLSSTETLLRNIQGLLKVAADNARQQERQTTYEKGECLGIIGGH